MYNIKNVVKNKFSLLGYFSKYIKVDPKGWALCPFHTEKTPSFRVYENQSWYCFGCHKGGDIFDFVMLMDNLGFKEALNKLAHCAGVNVSDYQEKVTPLKKINVILKEREQIKKWDWIMNEIHRQIVQGCAGINNELRELYGKEPTAQVYSRITFLETSFDYICQKGDELIMEIGSHLNYWKQKLAGELRIPPINKK